MVSRLRCSAALTPVAGSANGQVALASRNRPTIGFEEASKAMRQFLSDDTPGIVCYECHIEGRGGTFGMRRCCALMGDRRLLAG
jgi:hypothetical protein